MRFSLIAISAALLMGIQAAPIARSAAGSETGSSATLLLPNLLDVTSLLSVNNLLTTVETLPDNVQSQVLSVLNDPTQLVSVIQNLPASLQSELADLPSAVEQLPAQLQATLASLPSQLESLPAKLQAVLADLPATLQAKVAMLPTLIQGLPTLLESLPAKLQGLPTELTSALNVGDLSGALSTLQTTVGTVSGGKLDVQGLPSKLTKQLSFIESTLTSATGTASGVSSTVTTLLGTATGTVSTVELTVAQLKTVAGSAVSSVKSDVIAIPAKFVKGNIKKTVNGTLVKGVYQIQVSSLLTSTGAKVTALTDKLTVPTDLAKVLQL